MSKRGCLLGGLALGAVAVARRGKGRSIAEAAGGTSFEIVRSEEEWWRLLTPAQFRVLRQHDTERPSSSPLNQEHRAGNYLCAGCDLPLFSSETKFDSGTVGRASGRRSRAALAPRRTIVCS